jgi:hypothetical protein
MPSAAITAVKIRRGRPQRMAASGAIEKRQHRQEPDRQTGNHHGRDRLQRPGKYFSI